MTLSVAEETAELVEPTVALWAPGSAVLAVDEDASGERAVAVWQINPEGQPTGAWVVPAKQAYGDPTAARGLLVTLERRALAAADEVTVDETLGRLTSAADICVDRWWSAQRFSPVDVLGEVLSRRGELEATVAAVRGSGRTVAPLQWDRAFSPDDHPKTVGDLAELAAVASPAGAPVVAQALRLSRLLQWLVVLWTQTEQVKNRRDYLRERHGDPEALPPGWMAAVQTASGTRLPL